METNKKVFAFLRDKIKMNKATILAGLIFIIVLIAMLWFAIHSVDIYEGTFP
ncbi:MAG: hypothetical protein ACP5IJ_02205 [Candidatus Nanoarchaeia archaeon]